MKPEISETVSGYSLNWPDIAITIRASRLHVHQSDGRVTGEIAIYAQNSPPLLVYPPTTFNFSSARSRSTLVKELSDLESKIDWQAIINQMDTIVCEKARLGEPVRELWTSDDIEPPRWLLRPILYEGLPTIIFGEKGVAKSCLALAIYLSLLLPWVDNPLGWEVSATPTTCLVADYEADYKVVQHNAKKLQIGLDLPPVPVYYRRCSLPLADDIEQLSRHIEATKAEVLIVDSLAPAVGGDIKEAREAQRFASALRQLKVASLIIAQTSKDREAKTKSVIGSVLFEYYARNIFELRKVQEEGESEMDIALFNTFNNLNRRSVAQGYHLTFADDTTVIKSAPITARELVARLGIKSQITKLLARGPLPLKSIAFELDMNEPIVRTTLARMKDKGQVVKIEDGYGLATRV